jgi:tetratricopeptide (TPR) repeat protein
MPSLKQLEEFKNAFRTIGNEEMALADQNLQPEDYALPDSEPAPLPPELAGGTPPGVSAGAFPGAPPGGARPADAPDVTVSGEAAGPDLGGDNDFDFGAFLDTIPDDLSPPEDGGEAGGAGQADAAAPGLTGDDFTQDDFTQDDFTGDDFTQDDSAPGIPGDLLSGFADDIEAGLTGLEDVPPPAPEAFPEEDAPDTAGALYRESPGFDDSGGFDGLGDLEDMGSEIAEPEPADTGSEAGGALPDFGTQEPGGGTELPGPDFADDEMFSLFSEEPSIAEPDQSSETAETAEASGGAAEDTFDFPDFSNIGSGGDADLSPPAEGELSFTGEEPGGPGEGGFPDEPAPPEGGGFDLPVPEFESAESLDMGGESPAENFGDEGMPGMAPGGQAEDTLGEYPLDSFDTYNLGGAAGEQGLNLSEGKSGGITDFSGGDEFSLTGLDDIFEGITPKPAEPAAGGREGRTPAESAGDIEEINLTEEELARLQETLGSFPLNLRIACEELIAEQAVAPELMSALVKLLVRGANAKETAVLAGKILGRTIPIPKGFEKRTGEELEAEQASFAYILVHKFLPVLRIAAGIALVAASLFYLGYRFIYTPIRADSIYRIGYQRIAAGEYARANERFAEAFRLRRVKDWFYRYAEAFRDARQYLYAEEKYDELLGWYPRDKKGALDYAYMETYYLRNYSKADRILRNNILDYAVNDREGLLALGDNNLAWGEIEPARYENAREAYARLLEYYGWQDPIVERMMIYFIRTDNLGEVLPLQRYFTDNPKRKISAPALSELGGYLLSKRLEEPPGVPDAHIQQIEGIRDILFRAAAADPSQPEAYYHLARYYNHFGNPQEERQSLEQAIRAFDRVGEENPRRTRYRLDAEARYARILTNAREFFAAEEQLVKGIGVYEDALARRLLSPFPEGGKLYAALGDLEYFVKSGDMEAAIRQYRNAEGNGWAPPEMQYRMGSAYYRLEQWEPALERFFTASSEMPLNRRLLHALGNVSYLRGNYFAAQGYYRRLLDLLDAERARFPLLTPNERPDHMELAERMMVARNNLGVTLEALTERTGDNSYRSAALGLYAESARAWDAITRNPQTMIRSGAGELSTPGMNLAYINSRNSLNPVPGFEPRIYLQIDKDVLEPSAWEELAPPGYRLSDQLSLPPAEQ